jgi:serine/threonine protein kinase
VGKSSARELPKTVGRYEVVRQLGVGAMGRVFLARDPVLERHVAIKVLREDLHIADDDRESLLVRMRHEARAAARVTHPNLCVIHDMGEDDDLGLYLVFEYIEGPTLKQRLEEGRLTPRQAARVAKEIGSALTFAHDRGVLHRDVKPENLILSPTGTKLTDFGIARVPDSTLTHAGGLLGTPAYSAPETFQRGTFSPESDQFSFAATLYEAIRGARAFPGDDAISVASKIANDPPEPFATGLRYAPELDDLLQRGMAKDPAGRLPSCEDLGNKLTELLMLRTTLSSPEGGRVFEASTLPSRTSHAPRMKSVPPARSGLRWFALGVVALVGLGLLVRSALRYKPSANDQPPPATSEPSAALPPAPPSSVVRPRRPPSPRPQPPPSSKPVDEPRAPSSADAPPPP